MPIDLEPCNLYIDCTNAQIQTEDLFRFLVKVDENGCPAINVVTQGGDGPVGLATEATLQQVLNVLQEIDDNTDDLETIANNQLTELQAINLNTDNLEALLQQSNIDLAAILAELQTQTGILNTHTTALNNIVSAISTADTNNVTELQAIQTQLTTTIAELTAINANTAPLEASLTAIETAINTQAGISQGLLNTIITDLNTVITELQTMNATLLSVNGQFTGTGTLGGAVITGNPAYVVPAGTYKAIQIIVYDGEVLRGVVKYKAEGAYPISDYANKTLPLITLDASGSLEAYIEFLG